MITNVVKRFSVVVLLAQPTPLVVVDFAENASLVACTLKFREDGILIKETTRVQPSS